VIMVLFVLFVCLFCVCESEGDGMCVVNRHSIFGKIPLMR